MGIFDFLYIGLGWLMKQIYFLVKNYGTAIVLFTVLTKVLIFPLTLKQQKSSAQMQKVKPLIDEINKKYANDRQKLSEETMKVYQEHGISPTGGCLPLLIQLPIIFALYNVIQRPYTYIQGISKETLTTVQQLVKEATSADKVIDLRNEIELVGAAIKNKIDLAKFGISEINFNFLGLDLAAAPSSKGFFHPLIIIPIVAAVLTFLQSKLMYVGLSKEENELRKSGKKANARPPRPGEKKNDGNAMTGMTYLMPVMTLLFTYNFAAGIGLYWIAGSVIQIILTYVSNKFIIPKMKTKVKVSASNVEAMRNKMRETSGNNNRPAVRKGGSSDDIEEIRKKLREKRKNS